MRPKLDQGYCIKAILACQSIRHIMHHLYWPVRVSDTCIMTCHIELDARCEHDAVTEQENQGAWCSITTKMQMQMQMLQCLAAPHDDAAAQDHSV